MSIQFIRAALASVVSIAPIAGLAGTAAASDAIVPDQFPTIQSAVSNAVDVDGNSLIEIFVRAGTYNENVRITRSRIILDGENPSTTLIQGNGTLDVVEVEAFNDAFLNNVVVRGFSVTGGGAIGNGIEFTRVGRGLIDNNFTFGNREGIHVDRSNGIIVRNDVSTNNAEEGIKVSQGGNNRIVSNEANNNQHQGIDLDLTGPTRLDSNITNNNTDSGIRVRNSTDVFVVANFSTGNFDDGFRLESTLRATLTGNTGNANFSNGLRMKDTVNSLITQNTFNNNQENGIRLENSSNDDFSSAPGIQGPLGDNVAVGNLEGPLDIH